MHVVCPQNDLSDHLIIYWAARKNVVRNRSPCRRADATGTACRQLTAHKRNEIRDLSLRLSSREIYITVIISLLIRTHTHTHREIITERETDPVQIFTPKKY